MHHLKENIEKDIRHFEKDIETAKKELGTVIGTIIPELGNALAGEPKAITHNQYKFKPASVRKGPEISDGEKKCLQKRLAVNKACLEKIVGEPLQNEQILKVAMVNSGGGCRAALYTAGALCGVENIGILDAITHVTALSGSTWTVAPWMSSGMPCQELKKYIINCVSKSFINPTDKEELLIFDIARAKDIHKQKKTPVDLYGSLLGNNFLQCFGDDRHIVYLSDQAKKVAHGELPCPVYVAIDGAENIVSDQIWYEFTPHEIGNPIDGTYIPSWAYGRFFEEGESVMGEFDTYPPERNLAYHLGTFGSAFGANIETIEHEAAKRIGHSEFIEKMLKSSEGTRPLKFYAKVPNYMYKMNSTEKSKTKKFVDAGTNFNLPFPPILGFSQERKADVIIVFDASAGEIGTELKKAAAYAKKHSLAFPKINYEKINTKTISVFKNKKDPNVPIVIYMPRISDQELWEKNKSLFPEYNLSGFDLDYETNHGFAQTKHFHYESPEDARKVLEQAEFNIRVNQAKIIKTLKYAVERKKTT